MKFLMLFLFIAYFNVSSSNAQISTQEANCKIVYDKKDEYSGKTNKELQKSHLLDYINPRFRSKRKGIPFISIDASLAQIGEYKLINIFITIHSKLAQNNYGSINKGNLLMLKLINGEKIHAVSTSNDYGITDSYNNATKYQVSYTVTNDDLKQLSKIEIDRLGILWSSGYEEYEVYNVDFFMKQAACLKK